MAFENSTGTSRSSFLSRTRPTIAAVVALGFPLSCMILTLPQVSFAFSSSSAKFIVHRCGRRAPGQFLTFRGASLTLPSNGLGRQLRPSRQKSFPGHYATGSSLFANNMATSKNQPSNSLKRKASDMDEIPIDEKVMEGAIGKKIMTEKGEEEGEEEAIDEQQLLLQDDEAATIDDLYPVGIPATNSIIQHAAVPHGGFAMSQIEKAFSPEDVKRLKLSPDDVTVPAALMLLFPDQFSSQTKARKESRRRKILVHRGPLLDEKDGSKREFDRERLALGKVGDRVGPGDTLAVQTRMEHNYDECKNHNSEPPFVLPVVYQDDHMAVVNKPEGIVVFSHKNGGYGRHNVKSCLTWALDPPRAGVVSVMRRPNPVHRIDRGTSGLLVCAKTKPAMVELARMFKERRVKKTYTAIANGNIEEPKETSITSDEAKKLGVCVGDENSDSKETISWQIIDEELEGQSAVTIWRPLQRWPLENARNDTVSLVELKPKTGRYHQLRRHMAWVSKCPLLGDKSYDGGGLAKTLREQGFYLCSNKVTLEHPYYNTRTPEGRKEWDANRDAILKGVEGLDGKVRTTEEEDGTVLIHCEINLPLKFGEIEKQRDEIK